MFEEMKDNSNNSEMKSRVDSTKNEALRLSILADEMFGKDDFLKVMRGFLTDHMDSTAVEGICILLVRQQDEINKLRKQVNALASIVADK